MSNGSPLFDEEKQVPELGEARENFKQKLHEYGELANAAGAKAAKAEQFFAKLREHMKQKPTGSNDIPMDEAETIIVQSKAQSQGDTTPQDIEQAAIEIIRKIFEYRIPDTPAEDDYVPFGRDGIEQLFENPARIDTRRLNDQELQTYVTVREFINERTQWWNQKTRQEVIDAASAKIQEGGRDILPLGLIGLVGHAWLSRQIDNIVRFNLKTYEEPSYPSFTDISRDPAKYITDRKEENPEDLPWLALMEVKAGTLRTKLQRLDLMEEGGKKLANEAYLDMNTEVERSIEEGQSDYPRLTCRTILASVVIHETRQQRLEKTKGKTRVVQPVTPPYTSDQPVPEGTAPKKKFGKDGLTDTRRRKIDLNKKFRGLEAAIKEVSEEIERKTAGLATTGDYVRATDAVKGHRKTLEGYEKKMDAAENLLKVLIDPERVPEEYGREIPLLKNLAALNEYRNAGMFRTRMKLLGVASAVLAIGIGVAGLHITDQLDTTYRHITQKVRAVVTAYANPDGKSNKAAIAALEVELGTHVDHIATRQRVYEQSKREESEERTTYRTENNEQLVTLDGRLVKLENVSLNAEFEPFGKRIEGLETAIGEVEKRYYAAQAEATILTATEQVNYEQLTSRLNTELEALKKQLQELREYQIPPRPFTLTGALDPAARFENKYEAGIQAASLDPKVAFPDNLRLQRLYEGAIFRIGFDASAGVVQSQEGIANMQRIVTAAEKIATPNQRDYFLAGVAKRARETHSEAE